MNNQTYQMDIAQIIMDYQPELKSFIRKQVSSSKVAEDILQDVFFKLIKTIEDGISPIEQVATWLYRAARNTISKKIGINKSPINSLNPTLSE